jgi:uncharacterized protein (DUF58 family)
VIVPRHNLIWLAALCGVPLITIIGMGNQLSFVAAFALFLLIGVAVVDALKSKTILRTFQVQVKPRTNLFKGRPGEIDIEIINESAQSREISIGLNLPPGLISKEEVLEVELPADAKTARLKWPCTPTERGNFRLPSVHVQARSNLGLWFARRDYKMDSEIRVYPDLFAERKKVAMVFMHRRALGMRAQRQVGKGRDFEKLRDYIHGDAMEDVHWKATAKRGRLVTKVFQIERTQEVYVVLDCSRLTARISAETSNPSEGSQSIAIKTTVLDRFLTAALLLALATEQQGDHFGLVTFSDKVHKVIRAKSGKSHFALCQDALFDLAPRLVTPDFDELCATIRTRLRKRALVLFLTALDDPLVAESFVRSLQVIEKQHLIIVNMLAPEQVEPVFSKRAPKPKTPSDLYQSLAGHLVWQKLREIQKILEVHGIKFTVLENETLTRELVGQYLEVKQRQLI